MATIPEPLLNEQIIDTFAVVSLLIAVAAAYLAAIWPIVYELLGDPPTSDDYAKVQLKRKRTSYAVAAAVLTVFEVAVVLILAPLANEVFNQWDSDGPFDPVRAGLLLSMLILFLGSVATGVMSHRLWGKR